MSERRGNSTDYSGSTVEQTLENPEACTPEFLAACWEAARKRDPIKTNYERIDVFARKGERFSGKDVAKALELLGAITGDEAFRTALLALRAYGFATGGVKENLRRSARGSLNIRPAIHLALPRMFEWRSRVRTDVLAARLTAAQIGIPGQSFNSVVDELRKAYVSYARNVKRRAGTNALPTGDTGRKLRVKMIAPWLGANDIPQSEIRGVTFNASGDGIAPDDVWWRSAIIKGIVALHGVIEFEAAGKSSPKDFQDAH